MSAKLEYDAPVKRLIRAMVLAFATLVVGILIIPSAVAQINAAPPSVTSLGFGGRAINGTPPSVTSLGPLGYTPGFNPAFPNSRPLLGVISTQPLDGHHHYHHNGFFPWGWGVGYYAVPYGYYDQGDEAADEQTEDQYNGGPTIFDRRGSGRVARPPQMDYAEGTPDESASVAPPREAAPAPDQPQTVLVFKDGHQLEVENYAIVGSTLYDLTEGRRHKIPLSDLDLDTTTKQNEERGIDFQVPSGS
ncbi:MAG TPA: hypothetical protein VEG68_04635 [Terriglobales bacterium]|nr:hypothetical protein [Terriglobales bacterium]